MKKIIILFIIIIILVLGGIFGYKAYINYKIEHAEKIVILQKPNSGFPPCC